jgi:hypothetical protein
MSRRFVPLLESESPETVMADLTPLSPQEKLAISRKALMRVMARDTRHQPETVEVTGASLENPQTVTVKEGSAFSAMTYAARTWWRYHPAHAVFEVGRPLFDRYAARRPFQVLGIALAIGAAAVLLRPWRLVSIGGLLVAAVKSASAPGVLLSMLTARPDQSTKKS